MKLSFHGADRGVTGSCHLVECAGKTILVDCWFFQGSRESEKANAGNFGFDPAKVDFLLLTHAHLDHCGRIPLLVKRCFAGEIVATAATRELARVVLLDSAHLQEEAARNRSLVGEGLADASEDAEPLYGLDDALAAFDRFGRDARYDEPLDLAPGVRVTFVNAAHILGSAGILMELAAGETRRRVLFSGDLGNSGRPLLEDPVAPAGVDVVVMETTYAVSGGAVIMACSGMATGRRVLHHLRHNLGRPQSAVVFVGYAAEGTLAREIIDGAREVTIAGDRMKVRARIHKINGFSAHADQAELIAWRRRADPKRTILVRGEEAAMNAFVANLDGAAVERPMLGQEWEM